MSRSQEKNANDNHRREVAESFALPEMQMQIQKALAFEREIGDEHTIARLERAKELLSQDRDFYEAALLMWKAGYPFLNWEAQWMDAVEWSVAESQHRAGLE